MADRPRFGPAGVPWRFRETEFPVSAVPKYLHEEGLDAFEYEAVRWGQKPQIRREEAEALGINAKKHDVWLSVHGSYFINLCGEMKIVEASKKRLIACATAAKWMGARTLVFHPGFYGEKTPQEALQSCVKNMSDVVNSMRSMGLTNLNLGPEVAGRVFQLGTLNEILALCERVEDTEPVIDWCHIHARGRGKLKAIGDFRNVTAEIENRLGTNAVKNLHCHFTKVEFTAKGERRHRTLDEPLFGPDFRLLATLIREQDMKPVIISESPILDLDAQKMRDILQSEIKKPIIHHDCSELRNRIEL